MKCTAYMQGDRKMRYFENDLKTERFVLGKEGQVVQIIPSREDSLDRLVDENARQFSDEQESVESVVLHKLEVDRLHTALSLLTPEERALIQALFFEEKTERQICRRTWRVPQCCSRSENEGPQKVEALIGESKSNAPHLDIVG